ncbi:MAG: MATE family efflux transporter [Solobacterium sp.]|nr:MATE family efflux transporter [Solobacterium sp.]
MSKKQNSQLIRDLTTGSVPVTLLTFATPLFLSGLLQTVYNMVDMIVVGRFVGTNGLSAVAIGGEVLQLLTFVAMGISNAGQITISRYVGEGRRDRVGQMVGTMFTLLMSAAIILMIIFLFGYKGVMRWLNTPAASWDMTRDYIVTCICGLVFIYGYNMVSAMLRGMGDSRHPFQFIAIASVLNIILDLIFVAGMNLGAFGAALGTVIGQAVSFIFALRLLYRNREQFYFDFRPEHFRIYKEVIKPLLSLGIPMVIQSAAITFSMLFVNSYVNSYGVNAVAVTGVGRKIEQIVNIVSQAVSSAGGAMIAQALGASKTSRVPKVVLTAFCVVAVPAALMGIITVLRPEWLFGLFSSDEAVLTLALTYIPFALIQYTGSTVRPAAFSLINGSGNSRLNLTVALLDGIVCRIGLALLFGVKMEMGISGFWLGSALSGLVPGVIGAAYLLSGTWKNRVSVKTA